MILNDTITVTYNNITYIGKVVKINTNSVKVRTDATTIIVVPKHLIN